MKYEWIAKPKMDWIQNIEKTVKNQNEIAACEPKTTS